MPDRYRTWPDRSIDFDEVKDPQGVTERTEVSRGNETIARSSFSNQKTNRTFLVRDHLQIFVFIAGFRSTKNFEVNARIRDRRSTFEFLRRRIVERKIRQAIFGKEFDFLRRN